MLETNKFSSPAAKTSFTVEEVAQPHSADEPTTAQWIIIDAKVYDISRFVNLHPGGAGVLLAKNVAGKDATQAFFGLHRHEVLLKPQYARLQIGTVQGQEEVVKPLAPGQPSPVPYAEPAWLMPGFHSPYYNDKHREFQRAVRKFFEEVVYPDAVRHEDDGKRISQDVVDKLCEMNIPAMRIGPGRHLKGRTLMGGIVTPEEFDHFHEVCGPIRPLGMP
ncbi:hypothetical protein NUW54_g10798 [Trametes sanguinea]|uniref:Uncharacterized protein n=1 Tax=Trametes sanguinea TaxID=158606 RepID=A0ACC1NUH4_9APHY|nr:hypothetical protein NUW54_g10798 [Trametes sanguinea]